MKEFETELKRRLEGIRTQGLYRELRKVESPPGPRILLEGRTYLNFSSNDYLGLANEPSLKEAAIRAIATFGTGSAASRLVCGSLAPHHELEEMIAHFKVTEAALCFSSGYAAAMGAICALLGKEDVIVIDKLCHASIVDAARLCGAKLRVFAHNDLNDLEEILRATRRRGTVRNSNGSSRILIVTESVFGMDGDHTPLPQLIDLKDQYDAWLMIDEAHATGVYGPQRRGLAEAYGVSDRIEIQMGTLGKALGAAGGFICGSRALIDYLINRARSFIFTTAQVPAAAAAAVAGVRLTQSSAGAERRARLWRRVQEFEKNIASSEPNPSANEASDTGEYLRPANGRGPIIPLIVGAESAAVEAAAALRSQGIYVPAIRYPTVARGSARLRLTVTASHTSDDIAQLVTALRGLGLTPPSEFEP